MSENYEIHNLIYKYIMDYDKKGEEILKNIFGKILRNPEFDSLKNSSDYFDDLYNSFYEKKILAQREIFKEKFKDRKKGLISFLKTTIYNFLQDERDKKRIKTINIKPSSDEKNNNFDITDIIENPNNINMLEYIEAIEILEKFNEFFSIEDKKVICHIFFKDKMDRNYCIKEISKNALYKRVERMSKQKLPEFIRTYGITFDGFKFFKDYLLMSEICKKICL